MAVRAFYISNGFTTFRRCIFRDNFGIQQAGHVYCAYGTGRVDLLNCSLFSNKKDVTISNMATSKTGAFIYSESAGSLKLVNTSMMSMVTNRNTYPVFDIVSGGFVDIDQNSEIKCCEGQQLLLENNTHLQYTEKNKSAWILNIECYFSEIFLQILRSWLLRPKKGNVSRTSCGISYSLPAMSI